MSRADIEAGRAFVELLLRDKHFQLGLLRARRTLFDFAAGVAHALSPATWLKGIGDGLAGLGRKATVAGGAMAAAFIPTIKAASTAVETANKFQAVFGTQASGVGAWIDVLSGRVGRSTVGIKDSISAYQAFFKGLGFGEVEAAGMSKQMAALAIDLGSFFNKSDQESNLRFLSALSGSSEVLDQFGINTKQAALESELAAQGINKAWVDVTEPEKVLARMAIIRKSMSAQGAIGDAERTRGSLANLWKTLTGRIEEMATAVGTALIPVITPLVQKVTDIVDGITKWAQRNPDVVASIGKMVISLTALGAGLFAIGKALSFAGVVLGMAMKFSVLATIVVHLGPILLKVVSVLAIMKVAFAGVTTVLGLTLPMLAKFMLLSGGLVLGITAIGAAWANAKIQGISFGESVLDLVNKITGLENAYSRLRDTEAQQRDSNQTIRRIENAARDQDLPEYDRGMADLLKHLILM
jgi:hypothetical protein